MSREVSSIETPQANSQPVDAHVDRVSVRTAMSIAGINNAETYGHYRRWLGLAPGESPTREQAEEMRLCRLFCEKGRGKHFSRANFFRLKAQGTLNTELERLGITT